jgi:hypothetical protein
MKWGSLNLGDFAAGIVFGVMFSIGFVYSDKLIVYAWAL